MFTPKTERIKDLAEKEPYRVEELSTIFSGNTYHYIDYANVLPWARKLGWHIKPKRLKQFLDSFDTIKSVKFYTGTLPGDKQSEDFAEEIKEIGYSLVTKPVKFLKLLIDVTGIPLDSAVVIKDFMRKPFLKLLSRNSVESINADLLEHNKKGMRYIEDRKCNFDVEIGRDIMADYHTGEADNFVLWSNDSDFANPVQQLLHDGKRVTVVTTSGTLSRELSALRSAGLHVYEIKKMRNFICRQAEIMKVLADTNITK